MSQGRGTGRGATGARALIVALAGSMMLPMIANLVPLYRETDEFVAVATDPDVMRYVGDGRTLTRSDTERSVKRMMERWEADGFGLFTTVRRDDDAIIGLDHFIDLHPGHRSADHRGVEVAGGTSRDGSRAHARCGKTVRVVVGCEIAGECADAAASAERACGCLEERGLPRAG